MTEMPDQPEAQPAPSELDMLAIVLGETIQRLVLAIRTDQPNAKPVYVAAEVMADVADALEPLIGREGVRQGLLLAFEYTHDKPMNFIETAKARDALTEIAKRRREAEAIRPAGLILPH